jgi:hypothetical protein
MRGHPENSGQTPGNEGRFDGYDVLAQEPYWDEVTTSLIRDRMRDRGGEELRFFTESEAQTAEALFDLVLSQHEEPRVPVLHMVDQRLAEGETDGYRYEDMPEDVEAWRASLAWLDEDAKEAFGQRFHECSTNAQGKLVQGIQDASEWHGLSAGHVWSLWTRYACAAFYSHPWAWNEIGFGGPAYPRGYKVLHSGWREPWERPERDAEDPIPWMQRVEGAKQQHEVRTRHES